MFRTNEKKDIIILHKNENIDKYNLKKGEEKLKKMNKKFKRKSYSKIPSKNLFHRKNKRKLRKFGSLAKNEEICSSYHKIIEKMGKFSLITIAKWSSKLVRIVSDLGISITEVNITVFVQDLIFQFYFFVLDLKAVYEFLMENQEIQKKPLTFTKF